MPHWGSETDRQTGFRINLSAFLQDYLVNKNIENTNMSLYCIDIISMKIIVNIIDLNKFMIIMVLRPFAIATSTRCGSSFAPG